MKFFLDTANLDEIKEACSWGVVAGVTTNPTLVSKEGNIDFHTRVREIAEVVNGPVSAEAVSLEKSKLVEEAKVIAKIHPQVVVKIPLCPDGLGAVKRSASKPTSRSSSPRTRRYSPPPRARPTSAPSSDASTTSAKTASSSSTT